MNILLIYGGKSCEHDISIITACLAKGYFDAKLYCVYIDKDNKALLTPTEWTPFDHANIGKKLPQVLFKTGSKAIFVKSSFGLTKKIPIDYGVNCCHGVNGEDGAVSALLMMSGITEVESGVIPSGVAMDKVLTKFCLKGMGLPVVEGVYITQAQYIGKEWQDKTASLTYPLIVKPSTLGSSIGITVVRNQKALEDALQLAFQFDTRVLIEHALQDFYELNCAALYDGKEVITSRVERPVTSHDILTFDDKYIEEGGAIKSPDISRTVTGELARQSKQYTEAIYRALGMRGVVRVDYLVEDGQLYVNEINTVPGSLAYGLFSDVMSQIQFGNALLKGADAVASGRDNVKYRYLSNVLTQNIGMKK